MSAENGHNVLAKAIERECTEFVLVPGPNPILVEGGEDSWDGGVIEACNVLKDGETYYLYYHGTPRFRDEDCWPGYRLGVASASHPLGPWTKCDGNPIVDVGPEGSWEDLSAACAAVLKEQSDKYYMWYSGMSSSKEHPDGATIWDVGLAYSSNPLGPWEKCAANPVLEDFGYVGAVLKVQGRYYMYSEHPIGASSPDQGPFALAIADSPEGPWTRYEGNPVLHAGDWGAWDDGGFSEAGVLHHGGVFHTFYGGTKWRKLESIGYAYSLDGLNFVKFNGNPVVPRESIPNCSGMAEVHALWEHPLFYLYHTVRYSSQTVSRPIEHIGVHVLATQRPFRFTMPLLTVDSIQPARTTSADACPPMGLGNVSCLAVTTECTYHANAKQGLRLHVRASGDGLVYDTEDLCCFDVPCRPGEQVRNTVELDPRVMFARVLVENLDESQEVREVNVSATLGG